MQKDFDLWNEQKKKINAHSSNKHFCEREIWWCSLGLNIGYEQDGIGDVYLRPVLILKIFGPNTCLVVPLTSSLHSHHFRVSVGNIRGKNAFAIISQIRTIDTRRLQQRICYLSKSIFEQTSKSVKELL